MSVERDTAQLLAIAAHLWQQRRWTLAQYVGFQQSCVQYVIQQGGISVMRILANYGYKTNGDTYSVTFETMGDVPADQAPTTVDTLFRLAREAVKRQIASESPTHQQPTLVVTVPRPQVVAATNGNGSHGGNGERKHTIKDPSIPASPKQVNLLKRLAREQGAWMPDVTHLTMGEASAKIDELMAQRR